MKYIEELEQERQGKLDIETAEEIFERVCKEQNIEVLELKVKALEDRFNALAFYLNEKVISGDISINEARFHLGRNPIQDDI